MSSRRPSKLTSDQLRAKQALSFEEKVVASRQRVTEFADWADGQVFVSFSGGRDSTVLLHLVREILGEDTPAVFCDTGLEYPEVKEFVRSIPGVTQVRPKMSFREVIEKYGYPIISKETASYLREARESRAHGNSDWARHRIEGLTVDGRKTLFSVAQKHRRLVDAPFPISEKCCDVLKKEPLSRYQKSSGRFPIIGTMASDSLIRRMTYLKQGCNNTDSVRGARSRPLSFWLRRDIDEYIERRKLPIAEIYAKGADHTGCIFCAFGAHLEEEPNRFQRLKVLHPKLWHYCMYDLGFRSVLQYIGVSWDSDKWDLEWEEARRERREKENEK